jgi:hypothetical protein
MSLQSLRASRECFAVLIALALFACVNALFPNASTAAMAAPVQGTMLEVDPSTYQRTTIYSSDPQECETTPKTVA